MREFRLVVSLMLIAPFVASGYANLTPILSGAGCLYFPGTSPYASMCASSGALTITASGTNQNITLTPSGSGAVSITSDVKIPNGNFLRMFDSAGTARGVLHMDSTNPDGLHLTNNQRGSGGPILIETKAGGGESARFFVSGGFSLGSTSDPGTGVLNVSTGFTVGGSAPSNHVLIGNGTDYVDGTVPAASYNGHTLFTGTPTINSCGTGSPSVAGVDNSFTVTVGGGVVTSCSINFGASFTNPPSCTVIANTTAATMDIVSVGTSTVTFGAGSTVGGGKLYAHCF